ncbi:unnamed protein product [Protopolystoma xenopodis]|uniref:Uncharacterized protein n=1 Tax=Protopolystoma xenopodis TaxID=117903 RepID=A0A3S5CVS1_9PLAT|nr:unnamed protein product [Protopolystoma xenopodis]
MYTALPGLSPAVAADEISSNEVETAVSFGLDTNPL